MISSFQVMQAGGWDPSRPNMGSLFFDNLTGMSEEGLLGAFELLPSMIKARVESGEITPKRATLLNSLLDEFRDAMKLDDLAIRVTRMKEIIAKFLAITGAPHASG